MKCHVDSSVICVVFILSVIPFVANPAMTSDHPSVGPLAGVWNIEIVDSEGAVGRWCSHEIDVLGQVHVAYLDNSNFNLKYAKFDGSQWTNETVDNTGNAWSGMSLALDSWGRPHISYVDYNYFLRYAQWSGSAWSWETVTSVGPLTGLGVDTSIALDSLDVPHIAYLETDTGNFVVASKPSGWVFETVDTPGHEYWVTLEIDSSDTPHVAYMNSTLEDLVYATKQGASWMTETVDSSGSVGFMPSIALNASSSPRIAYFDIGNESLKYAEKNGSSWDVEVVDTIGTSGQYPSLQVDEMGNPGIAHHDAQSRDLRYAWNSNGVWHNETVDTEVSVGYFASLAYASENQPTVAYFDITKGDLKFAWGTIVSGPSPPFNLSANLSEFNLQNVILSWQLSADDGGGNNSVIGYQILRGSDYEPAGLGYSFLGSVPSGVSVYIDVGSGEGDPDYYFYLVCALDMLNSSFCSENQAGKFTRPLSQGPNLVSIPLIQSDESIETVLQTVKNDKAWYYDSSSQEWKWFMKHKGYRRGLWNVNHTMGLWVNVTEDSNLTVAGVVPAQTTIHLHEGWNLVSFPSFKAFYSVSDLKAEIGATRVEGYDLAPPNFLRVLGDAEVLLAGEAYWVSVQSEMDWVVKVA